jgi:sugar phosphate isomerase/epimerase
MSSVLPVAIARHVKFAVENHDGLSSDPAVLAEFVRHFHSPYLGVCLDFGNFEGDPKDLEKSLGSLAPHAMHVHAKSREFSAQGEETQIDYRMRGCADVGRLCGRDQHRVRRRGRSSPRDHSYAGVDREVWVMLSAVTRRRWEERFA